MPQLGRARVIRPVALVVGEGYAEIQLLRQIRALYTSDRHGHRLALGNARGKSATHIIDYTIRVSAQGDYHAVASLLDTDTGLTVATRKRASECGVALLLSEPCLEAWLLATVGRSDEGPTTELKRRFREHFGGNADEDGLIQRHFPREVFDAGRNRIEVLDQLLRLLGA